MNRRPWAVLFSADRLSFKLLAFASLILLFLLLPTLYQRLACPFQVQQEEAVNMEFGRVLLSGETLYRDIRKEGPYLHPYASLYPVFLSVCMRVLPGQWLPGRLPAILAFLCCAFLLGAWGWKRWGIPVSLSLTGVFLLSPTWLSWGTMARMDTLLVLANFAAFLTLYPVVTGLRKNGPPGEGTAWVLAGLANSIGFLMKASACTFTLAALAYALWNRKWKMAGLFLLAVSVPFALNTAYWQWKSQGAYLMLMGWEAGDLHLAFLAYLLKNSFLRECGWLLLALLPFLFKGRLHLLLKLQLLFSGLWFLTAALMSTSAENHYMEFLLFGFFALGEGLSLKETQGKIPESYALAFLVLGVVLYSTSPAPRVPSPEEMKEKSQMLSLYEKKGDYLAIDADLPYMSGQRMWYQYSGMEIAYLAGYWEPAPLIRDIRAHKFTSIEFYSTDNPVPQPVEQAVKDYYHVSVQAYGRDWWVPKPEGRAAKNK